MSKQDSDEVSPRRWQRRSLGLACVAALLLASWALFQFSTGDTSPDLTTTTESSEREPSLYEPGGPRRFSNEEEAQPEAVAEDDAEVESEGREVVLSKGPFRGLYGIVVDPQGARIPYADVSLFDLETRQAISAVRAFDTGQFYLSTLDLPSCSAVLSAYANGFQPYSKRLEILPGFDERGLVLKLGAGCDLAGQVTLNGLPSQAHISVDIAYGVPGLHGATKEIFAQDGVVVAKHGRATTGADSRFRLKGLANAEYRVDACIQDRQRRYLPEHLIRQVQAPTENCLIDFQYVTQVVEVQSDGKFVEGAALVVRHAETRHRHHGSGRMDLGLLAGELYLVSAVAEGYLPRGLEFRAPESSSSDPIIVNLERAPQRSLVIEWLGAHELDVRAIEVRLEPTTGERAGLGLNKQESEAVSSAQLGNLDWDANEPRSSYVWDGLPYPPGRYSIKISARRAKGQRQSTLALPSEAIVEIPAFGEVTCSVPCRAGSLLRLVTTAQAGKGPWGNWELRDTLGKGAARGFMDLTMGAAHDPSPQSSIIESGDYVLKIETEGREIQTYNLKIAPGVIHYFEVNLSCPPKPHDLGPWFRSHQLGGITYMATEHGAMMFGSPFF